MTVERMLKLIVLQLIKTEYWNNQPLGEFLEKSYDLDKLDNDYISLLDEFLTPYALNKTEKSD